MNVLTLLGSIDVESAERTFSLAPLDSFVGFIIPLVLRVTLALCD